MKRLFFLCKCHQGGKKKATPDVVRIKQPRAFGLPSIIGYSQETLLVVVVGFFKIHLFCYFISQKHDLQYAIELSAFQPACTLIIFQEIRLTPHIEVVYALQVHLMVSKPEEHLSSKSSRQFVPKTSKRSLCP